MKTITLAIRHGEPGWIKVENINLGVSTHSYPESIRPGINYTMEQVRDLILADLRAQGAGARVCRQNDRILISYEVKDSEIN